MDAEVLSDLSDRDVMIALLSNTHHIVFELLRVRLGHDDNPSRLGVTEPDHLSPIPAPAPRPAGVVGKVVWSLNVPFGAPTMA
ncbi:hypothetical protein [Brevibacterium gallinarum]|uniref:hypothetical protein n=1 Tax=Brevibacterium gallinarum TaxID=2762220 RepID=UPI001CD8835E|nr:hypothetical protein [Brevibacterium gallinarum]